MRVLKLSVIPILFIVLMGCAVHTGIYSETEKIDLQNNSLILMTVQLSHDLRPGYKLAATQVEIEMQESNKTKKVYGYVEEESRYVLEDYCNHYITMYVKPGKVIIRGIRGNTFGGAWMGRFFLPLHSEVSIKAGSIIYLGKVNARTRERNKGEFRSGGAIPLLDQGLSGMSGSTFDIEIVDNYDEDVKFMRAAYPLLKDVSIEKMILPQFDRAYADKWWDEH